MSKTGIRVLIGLWVSGATLALAHLWLTHPSQLPSLPSSISLWLIELYGARDGEQLRDLETLTALGVAFFLVIALTLSCMFFWRRRN